MAYFMTAVIVVGVVGLGLWAWSRATRRPGAPRRLRQPETDTAVRPPEPDEGAATRHGHPIEGSRADREHHGKP